MRSPFQIPHFELCLFLPPFNTPNFLWGPLFRYPALNCASSYPLLIPPTFYEVPFSGPQLYIVHPLPPFKYPQPFMRSPFQIYSFILCFFLPPLKKTNLLWVPFSRSGPQVYSVLLRVPLNYPQPFMWLLHVVNDKQRKTNQFICYASEQS